MKINTALAALIAFCTPTRSVASITADLERTFGQLDQAERALIDKAAAAELAAAKLVKKAVDHRVEANRARRIGNRLNELLS